MTLEALDARGGETRICLVPAQAEAIAAPHGNARRRARLSPNSKRKWICRERRRQIVRACPAPGAQGLGRGAEKADRSTEAQGPRRILAHIGAIRLALAGKPLPATMERRGGELLTRRSPTASARDKQSTHRFQLPGQLVSGV